MSVSDKDILSSAERLLVGSAEVDSRNAASRAYYAAYHACIKIGEKLPDYSDVEGGVHAKLISKLEQHPVKAKSRSHDLSIRSLGYRLRQARDARIEADYHINQDFSYQDAELAVRSSNKILQDVTSRLNSEVA